MARERGVPIRAGLTLDKHLNPFHNYPDGRRLRSWQAAEYREIRWFQERKRPAKLRLPKARGAEPARAAVEIGESMAAQ